MDSDGSICEQGTFDELNSTGGYVSSFSLPAPDWNFKPEKERDCDITSVVQASIDPRQTSEGLEAEANRRTGDTSIYIYYVGSIGWVPAVIFIVAISGFVFCLTFPRKC